jgi:hypothetical protein
VTEVTGMTTASFGADRDWLLRFCPSESLRSLNALFEVEREVTGSLKPGLEHSVAHARLEWWSDELSRLAQGSPRHPATRVLASMAIEGGTTPPDLTPLIEHVQVDLACVAFLSRAELDEHLESWGKSIFRAASQLDHSHSTPEFKSVSTRAASERLAAAAGKLVRELELLRDFSSHAVVGRIYVPLGDPPEPHSRWAARPLGESEASALSHRRETIRRQLKNIAADISSSDRPALRVPMLWMSFAASDDHGNPALLSPLRRTIAAWRGAFALSRGRLPDELT